MRNYCFFLNLFARRTSFLYTFFGNFNFLVYFSFSRNGFSSRKNVNARFIKIGYIKCLNFIVRRHFFVQTIF